MQASNAQDQPLVFQVRGSACCVGLFETPSTPPSSSSLGIADLAPAGQGILPMQGCVPDTFLNHKRLGTRGARTLFLKALQGRNRLKIYFLGTSCIVG